MPSGSARVATGTLSPLYSRPPAPHGTPRCSSLVHGLVSSLHLVVLVMVPYLFKYIDRIFHHEPRIPLIHSVPDSMETRSARLAKRFALQALQPTYQYSIGPTSLVYKGDSSQHNPGTYLVPGLQKGGDPRIPTVSLPPNANLNASNTLQPMHDFSPNEPSLFLIIEGSFI